MESCRSFADCLSCIDQKCVWTSNRKFPCRWGPDDTDKEIFTSCERFILNNTFDISHDAFTREAAPEKILLWVLGSLGIILLLVVLGLDFLKNFDRNIGSAQWSLIRKPDWKRRFDREMETLILSGQDIELQG